MDAIADAALPPETDLDDGLTRDEAISIALWRSPDFVASLAELEVARAAVFDAGLLRDPVLTLLFPVGPKQLEATLNLPIDALWLRDRRVAVADAQAQRLASELASRGLDLVRDVQRDFDELRLAVESERLEQSNASAWNEIARLETLRVEIGEAAPVAASDALVAARTAEERRNVAQERIANAELALARRMGLDPESSFVGSLRNGLREDRPEELGDAPPRPTPSEAVLLHTALACRPELRAAEMSMEDAGERMGLAREEVWRVSALIDENAQGIKGAEFGPGLVATLPIFAGAKGARARAAADLQVASARYAAVLARIAFEVRDAVARMQAAERASAQWRERIVPQARASVEAARRGHENGALSSLDVRRNQLLELDAQLQATRAAADVRNARAQLERAVGRRDLEAATGKQ